MAEEKKEEVLEEVLEDLEAEDAKNRKKHRIPPQKKKEVEAEEKRKIPNLNRKK